MSMIQISHLTFGYDGSPDLVFADLDLRLDTTWRLGLIGRNGRGKSTLLRLLAGELPHGGAITGAVGTYFPQRVRQPEQLTVEVLGELCPGAADWEIQKELNRLGLEEAAWRPFSTLSGGEQTRALLAALFLDEGRYPLIDEPTNHLDEEGRRRVAAYLRTKPGFLLVSHDRAFLDGCVDHILSIERSKVRLQAGNWTEWNRVKTAEDGREQAENEQLRREIRHLQQAARRSAQWSDRVEQTKYAARNSGLRPDRGYIGHKAAKMMARSKAIQNRQERAAAEKEKLLKNIDRVDALRLTPLSHPKELLAEGRDLCLTRGAQVICGPMRFAVRRGTRLAVTGPNGCGKSTLLRLLAGEEGIGCTGHFRLASGLRLSIVPQDTGWLKGSLRDWIAAQGVEESFFKALLRKLGLEQAQFDKDLADYSAGQKKKVLLAGSLCRPAHLYLWDEPLNYIDLPARQQLEELICQCSPTLVFVEHDRAFREAVATEELTLQRMS